MRVVLALTVLGACGFAPTTAATTGDAGDAAGSDVGTTPHYRKQVTITANSPTPLVDFPASIVLAADADLAAHARDDGTDLGFTAADGTPIPFEVVAFDGTTGALEAWVRVPSVTASTDVYLVYGGMSVAAGPAATWAPDYAAAWHLAEPAGAWTDSAAAHTVTPASATTTAAPTTMGVIGAARLFDGVDDATPGPDPADGSLDFGTGSFTVSVWVNVTSSADPYDMVIDKGGDTNMPGYCLTLGTSNWLVEISDGPNVPTARFGGETEMLGHWNQLVAVIDRGTSSLVAYTNGALAQSTSIASVGSLDSTFGFAIGSTNSMYTFKGLVDEVRVVKRALAADWIAAEYRNAMMRAQFVTLGAEATL